MGMPKMPSRNMSRLSLDMATHVFFDSRQVERAVGKANRKNLMEIGKRVRRRAKAGMKLAPAGKASPEGQPPHAHRKSQDNRSGGGLKRSVLYAFDPMRKSVVAGPSTRYGRNIATVAARHEFGETISEDNPRRTVRKRGDGGELRYERSRRGVSAKKKVKGTTKLAPNTLQGKVFVTYGKLHTQAMAARANRIQKDLYGPMRIQGRYPKRLHMRTAMARTRPELPSIWRDSVKV